MERPLNVRSEYQGLEPEQLKKIQNGLSFNCEVLLFNIRTSGNIAMIIRTACLMGCKQVIICGRKHYDKRFTVGAENYIPVNYIEKPLKVTIDCKKGTNPVEYIETYDYNVEEFIKCCEGRTPVFLEQGGKDIRGISWKLVENPLVILGNESIGIPRDFIKSVKEVLPKTLTVSIQQYSVMRSLNVAVAASIVLWEINKAFSI
jgi:tRNA G18 (ribose-2'-O)-methylase SpoU